MEYTSGSQRLRSRISGHLFGALKLRSHIFQTAFEGAGFVGRFAAKPRVCFKCMDFSLTLSISKSIMAEHECNVSAEITPPRSKLSPEASMHRNHTWSDVYVDHELASVDGSEEPLADLPLPSLCWGFCSMVALWVFFDQLLSLEHLSAMQAFFFATFICDICAFILLHLASWRAEHAAQLGWQSQVKWHG